jgi:hypothetical protein
MARAWSNPHRDQCAGPRWIAKGTILLKQLAKSAIDGTRDTVAAEAAVGADKAA